MCKSIPIHHVCPVCRTKSHDTTRYEPCDTVKNGGRIPQDIGKCNLGTQLAAPQEEKGHRCVKCGGGK